MKISLLVFMVILSVITYSQDIPITFQVDMSYQMFAGNFPAGANVVVRGSFQTDFGDPGGNWQGNLYQLSDPDDDTVYTGTFSAPASLAGNTYIFKFVIVNPPAGDNWESISERQFTLTTPSTLLPVVYFNDDYFIYDTLVTNTINFTADISDILGVGIGGAFDPTQDSLLVMGLDWDYLGQDVTGDRRMTNTDPFNAGIYTTTLSVTSTAGILENYNWNDSTNWKFKTYPDSRFQNSGWEFGDDRCHIYEADGTVVDLPTIIPRIYPNFGVSTNEIDFTLNVDMTGAVNFYNGEPIPVDSIDYVVLLGSVPWLGNSWVTHCWCPDDTVNGLLKVLTHTSGNIWSYDTTLPSGINLGPFEFRFGAMYPGADTVNDGIAYLNNEFPFGTNHFSVLLDHPISVSNNWFGHPTGPDAVEQIKNIIPDKFKLEQNYPNPFNPSTKIRYSIPENSFVSLRVFNLLGEEIETLVNGEQSAGVYEATLDASHLTSGVYIYTLKTKNFTFSKKMILVR
jgi:hypothetical protein